MRIMIYDLRIVIYVWGNRGASYLFLWEIWGRLIMALS
jgi:hypothetical protein